MPTIANLPGADVEVEFPDGTVQPVNMIRLLVQTQNAEMKARHGMFLPGVNKLHPTVKALRDEYPSVITATTWENAALQMRAFHTALKEGIDDARA
jgi:hypothetical protein